MTQFELETAVDPRSPIRPEDIVNTKRALSQLGFYDIPAHGITDFTDDEMFAGIKAFQHDQELPVDGVMNPGGPTEIAIGRELGNRDRNVAGDANQLPTAGAPSPYTLGLVRDSAGRGGFDEFAGGQGEDSLVGGGSEHSFKSKEVEPREKSPLTERASSAEAQKLEAATQGVFARLSREGIDADRMRLKYVEQIAKASREVMAEVELGKITAEEGAIEAYKKRDHILGEIRKKSTHLGEATAAEIKAGSLPFEDYENK